MDKIANTHWLNRTFQNMIRYTIRVSNLLFRNKIQSGRLSETVRNMKFAYLSIFILCTNIASIAGDYVVCATSDYSEACKRIEAARKDIRCLKVRDSVDCLQKILRGKAHFGTFTPEEAILATYFADDDVRVIAEVRHEEKPDDQFAFQTVVIVHKDVSGGFSALQNATYCHPGFSQGRYWSNRILKYFESKIIDHFGDQLEKSEREMTADEEELNKLSKIFRKACRPGVWSVSEAWDKKLKRDYSCLCANCDFPSTCSYKSEIYNEHFSALKCLTEGGGNVAYTALSYVNQYFNLKSEQPSAYPSPEDYKFLCKDGSTRPISGTPCPWISQPWSAIISSRSTAAEVTEFLQEAIAQDLSISTWKIGLRKILANGAGIFKFKSGNVKLSDYIREGREVPQYDPKRKFLNWCTVSEKEQSKCTYMASAALAFGVPVQLNCTLAPSKVDCMKMIEKNDSDLTFIDTQMGFVARKVYNLTAAAFVETEKIGNYYGVVVMKGNSIKRFKDLRGKRACFPVYNGLGWLSHVQNLRRLNLVPNMLCSDSYGLWNYFSKVCAPGAKTPDLNKFSDITPNKICEACNGIGSCEASKENPYYCEIGALRCINRGDGDVAVLTFHAIKQLFESGSNETSGLNLDDFKILCRDETISDFSMEDPEKCSITQLNGGEIVMKRDIPLSEKRDISLTLIGLDDLLGHSLKQYPPTFRMYESFEGETNLLFKDTAVALISVFDTQNDYVNNYLKLQNEMSVCYRDNGTGRLYISMLAIILSVTLLFIDG